MIERNLLIGNGINIAFSGNDDYKNYRIIERLTKYLNTNRYDDVFQGSISSAKLYEMLRQLNDGFQSMLKGMDGLLFNMDEYVSGDDMGEEATAILLEIEKAGFKWTWYNEDEYQILIRW